jgi:hypothetical protein
LTKRRLSTKVATVNEAATELPADPADALAAVVALRRLADRIEDAEVERALREGWTWSQVAEALGVTRQAVHKKHARRLADASRG